MLRLQANPACNQLLCVCLTRLLLLLLLLLWLVPTLRCAAPRHATHVTAAAAAAACKRPRTIQVADHAVKLVDDAPAVVYTHGSSDKQERTTHV